MAREIEFEGNELDAGTRAAIVNNSLIEGARPVTWWTRQANDLHENFMNEMRTSLENGEGIQKATTRIVGGTIDGVQVPGIMDTARRNAQTLARTAINKFTNEARIESFAANDDIIKAIEQISTLDNRTSEICIAYDGQVWANTPGHEPIPPSTLPFNGGPPRHFNCRSTLAPVLKSWEELGIPAKELSPSTRASMDGQLPADTTFDAFLKSKTVAFQNQMLGVKKAELWRQGKITLTQLVDFRGNPLTADQLEQRAVAARKPPPPKPPPAPPVVPEFKNNAEAEAYYQEHMLREPDNFGLGWSKSYDRNGLRIAAQVTTDMRSRFGMAMPRYQGMSTKHPKFRFKGGRGAFASVHFDSDSLMFGTKGVSVKKMQEHVNSTQTQKYKDFRNNKRTPRVVGRDAPNPQDYAVQRAKNYPDDKALQVAVAEAKKVGNEFTVGDFTWKDGAESIWGTFVHESGHRLHARHFKEINAALANQPGFIDNEHMYLWMRSVSQYGATNREEFVAESFVHYMRGDTNRVFPPLLAIFRKYDKTV